MVKILELKRKNIGVADGARTHDNRNHNPGLYQLSYSHRRSRIIAETFFLRPLAPLTLAWQHWVLAPKFQPSSWSLTGQCRPAFQRYPTAA